MEAKHLYAAFAAIFGVIAIIALVAWTNAPSEADVQATVDYAVSQAVAKERTASEAQMSDIKSQYTTYIGDLQTKVDSLSTALESTQSRLATVTSELDTEKKAQEDLAGAVALTESGELIDDLQLGDIVNFNLDDGKVSKLFDGTIKFLDDEYEVQERFVALGSMYIGYSGNTSYDEHFGAKSYIVLENKEILSYRYEFDDPVLMSDITNNDPLRITFLGEEVEIVNASASEITFRTGKSFFVNEGTSFTFDGKTVQLAFISDNNRASVCVDGECKTVQEYDTETINGVDVRVEDILVNSRAGSATIVLGTDVLNDQKNSTEFSTYDDFNFYIETSSGQLTALVVMYDERSNDLDDDVKPLAVGEEVCFPNKYVCVKYNSLLYTDYRDYTMQFQEFDEELKNGTDVVKSAVLIETSKADIEVASENVKELYVAFDGKVYYQDNDGEWLETVTTDVKIVNNDYTLLLDVVSGDVVFIMPTAGTLVVDTNFTNEQFGLMKDEAETTDVIYASNTFGTFEYDLLTISGLVVKDVESNADNDELSFSIPSDVVEAEVLVY